MSYSRRFLSLISLVALLHCIQGECPKIVSREEWDAKPPKNFSLVTKNPPPYIVVHHSATKSCFSEQECKKLTKSIQTYHMVDNNWSDIGYNFLIGGDGSIYEGRGWGIRGAHCVPYNGKSIGVCLLGNFQDNPPPNVQLKALADLISCAQENDKITADYHLIGHKQGTNTLCPGKFLFAVIEQWPHFDSLPK